MTEILFTGILKLNIINQFRHRNNQTIILFYSIQFTCTVFCSSVTIFLCYLCPDEGLCKTETHGL